jgi:hypothetical protein
MKCASGSVHLIPRRRTGQTYILIGYYAASLTPSQALRLAARLQRWALKVDAKKRGGAK